MATGAEGLPIEDVAYLSRSDHRVTTLIALTERPRSRSELWEMTGVSSSTIRRTLREFEDRKWITRDGYQYETTPLGGFVATAMSELLDRLETERKLRDVWEWLPDEETGFSVEMCLDATVTVASAENPYSPVNRFLALLRETEDFRFVGLDVALLEPSKTELCERVIDGMETEMITPPRVANYIRSSCPDLFSEALESGNLTVRLHDGLPRFGVCLFDDCVAISGYDPDNVMVRALVDTAHPSTREWAESVYRAYRRQTPTIGLEPAVE